MMSYLYSNNSEHKLLKIAHFFKLAALMHFRSQEVVHIVMKVATNTFLGNNQTQTKTLL